MEQIKIKLNKMNDVLINLIENKNTKLLINKISETNELILSGIGKNWYICQKLEKTFISLGINAYSMDATHAIHGDIGKLNNQTIIFISKSGETKELIELIDYLYYLNSNKIINVFMIGVFLNSNIKNNKLNFIVKPSESLEIVEFDSNNLIPTLSINTIQSYLDYVAIKLFESNKDLISRFKFNHPSGTLGKILQSRELLNEK